LWPQLSDAERRVAMLRNRYRRSTVTVWLAAKFADLEAEGKPVEKKLLDIFTAPKRALIRALLPPELYASGQ